MSLDSLIKDLNKIAGDGAATIGDERSVEVLPTGILPLDAALGIGGLPKGRVVELHSPFSVGKTSLAFQMIANLQKRGLICGFVDTEFTYLPSYAKSFGVETDKLVVVRCATGEQALEAVEKMIRSKEIAFVVVDSVSGLVPVAQAEAEHGKHTIGAQAKLLSQGLAKLLYPLYDSGAILLLINQLRVNIMGGQYDPYTLPGGLSLRHYASIMLELKRKATLKQGEDIIGTEIEVVVKKNKVGMAGQRAVIQLYPGKGFSAEADILSAAEKLGKVKIVGNTYWFGEEKLGVGYNKTRKYLEAHPDIMAELSRSLAA